MTDPPDPRFTAKDLVLAIDCSTTASKAIAWDRVGAVVAEGRAPLGTRHPHPGWSEQPAADWWDATVAAVRHVTGQIDAHRIAAVCVTTQRETFVPVDAAGQPLRDGILWNDERSRDQLAELDRRLGAERIHALTGRPPSMTQSLPKLLWLVQHEPEIARAADTILDVSAYLNLRLTGAAMIGLACADPMGIVDMAAGRWADDLITGVGLRLDQLPPIVRQGEPVGAVTPDAAAATGLRAGTPVVAGAGDGQSASLGAGVTGPGRAFVNLGTAVAAGCVSPTYRTDLAYRTCGGGMPGTFVLESLLRGGTATVTWFMEELADPTLAGSFAAYEAEAAALPPGAGGLMLVPYWNTVMNPYWDPAASGITVGWTTATRRANLYRALMEGIAHEYRLSIEGIVASSGEPVGEHVVLGGGSRSDLWCRILADVLGAPVRRAASVDATNLGAAILAAVAAGWYADATTAAAAMTGTAESFLPDPASAAAYDRLHREVYVHLFPALRPYLDRLTELTR